MDNRNIIKKIMVASFNENFFVTTQKRLNEQYIEKLTDKVITRFASSLEDYNEIANHICEYNFRVKTSYSEWEVFLSIPLLSELKEFKDLFYKKVGSFNYILSDDLLRRIQKILHDKNEVFSATIVYLVVQNYSCYSVADKEQILLLFEKKINEYISVKSIKHDRLYSVKGMNEDIYQDMLTQILVYKYCQLTNSLFNYQTPHSIVVFDYLDKEKMYFDIRESIIHSFSEHVSSCSDEYGKVLSKLIGYTLSIPKTQEFNDYGLLSCYNEWLASNDTRSLSLLKTIFDMMSIQNNLYYELFTSCKNESTLRDENIKMKSIIDNLIKEKATLERRIIHIIHQSNDNKKELASRISIADSEKKELFALRELLFTLGKDEIELYDDCDFSNSEIDYSRIVIIGGHIKWAQKIKNRLPDIDIISADQKNVDLKFIRNKSIVLFFINYISHSQYLKTISKIKSDQKVGFIKRRRIDDVINEIANIYRSFSI